ncbi:hypothetical protein SGFS_013190 [Streptomyces graminofaciens]|uniref:Uncharacterized protein n=1 Tax=Streptomyces graminofaciens TaxID=68212 RepID=A0ABN5V9Q3_9ACTN|nr:hypothetical protein [Streptomyces graminofaciens]BBC30025.1 hypothetical protein SGFS_013190 [Streptomyces graminofaciens]
MFRILRWALLAAFLIVVGLWPAVAAPIGLAAAGLAVVVGMIPGPVLALGAVALWLRHRPATA